MADTWIDKDEQTIRDDIIAIAKKHTGLTNFKSTGVLRGFLEVIVSIVSFVYTSAINVLYKNASLDGAEGFFLSLWGLMLGVVRKQEAKTEGAFTGTAYDKGKIPAGLWVAVEGSDIRFRTTVEVSFEADTTFGIPVIAEFPGDAYNISPGTKLRLTRFITGFNNDTLTADDEWITSVGQEVEEDNPYRERIRSRWRSQILGDTKETYRFYAESVPGVRSAQIIRTPRGAGTTDVIIASMSGIPSAELIHAVETALHDHELMGFDVQVKPPAIIPITVEIEYSGNAEAGNVQLVAESYIHDLGIGGRFTLRDLYIRYETLDLKTIEILSPSRDVQPATTGIIVIADITVTKVAA
jgi:hypothetical protein